MITYKIAELAEFLNKHGIKFIVCGSAALSAHGLSVDRLPHDIDIEAVLDTDEKKRLIDTLVSASKGLQNPYSGGEKVKIFYFDNVIVNLFPVSGINYWNVLKDDNGVYYTSVLDIIARKNGYGREKDKADLLYIITSMVNAKM